MPTGQTLPPDLRPNTTPSPPGREDSRAPAVGMLERALSELHGYDPHAARRWYYAAIARLAGRYEMIVAARDKKLEAVRENRKLKRPTTTRLYSLIPRQTRSLTLNHGNTK